ncbi:hypothetical protein AVEN_199332-1 [Araneus ventricosus]|uniref:Uncharacterized protein n=1 Tax=Araneus ventricosus TaxID=182803 RepID=A0A4Y2J2F8_ARAVE|nr:hypothetical protein AVEN_199332-1 [Araneus ventricosus]
MTKYYEISFIFFSFKKKQKYLTTKRFHFSDEQNIPAFSSSDFWALFGVSLVFIFKFGLAKEAITEGEPFLLPKPLSYLKSEIKSAALSIWQDNWDNGETGRSTHDIVPRVSNKPVGWNREEIMFVTGHGPFPSYLHRFNLRTHDNCSCGEKGDPIHYATKCQFTLS